MIQETQAYLDALRSPEHLTEDEVQAAIRMAVPLMQQLRAQVGAWKAAGQLAEMLEPQRELVGRLGLFRATVDAMDRMGTDLERVLREMSGAFRQLRDNQDTLRPELVALGYVVDDPQPAPEPAGDPVPPAEPADLPEPVLAPQDPTPAEG